QDVYPAWAHSPEDVAAHFNVDLDHGLSDELVAKQRALHGFNELDHAPATPLWKLVLQQFDDTLVKILLLAAGISFALAWFDEGEGAGAGPAVIILILVLNAVVGVWQEGNAESALEALKEMSAETAKVFRAGHLVPDLPCRDLVPGDVVEVHTGDLVPADVRVVRLGTALFRVEQAALTGESAAVSKHAARLAPAACELHAKDNVLFAGTGVAAGTCRAVVYATGMRTEIGRIQAQIQAAAEEEGDTPLKKRLDEFGEALARIILYVCVAVWLINYRHFISWKTLPGSAFLPDPASVEFSLAKATFYFKVAVALAVAAIPEGLPAVITTCLALGTRKMARRNAIVRKLPSVETLGCTTVICSDKTGTLTTNQMAVSHVVTLAGAGGELRTLDVTGTSYNPADGEVRGLGAAASGASLDAGLAALAATAALCNGARIATKHGHAVAVGQSTEAALLVLAEKLGAPDASERDDAAARPAAGGWRGGAQSLRGLRRQARVLARPGGLCISRAEPGHKQDVVRRLRNAGEVTAMTGDGVNDAPALKLADIGIAMGVTGTEVAKEAADMVLADDNFATVVAAVEEGRAIFNNMKAFIRYMISSNIGEVASIFLSAALGLPEGLIPVQLLWVNLVTDGPPATALGFNPPDPDIMSKPPRRGSDHFLTPWLLFRWVVVGCYVGFATVGAFATWYTSTTFLGFIDLSRDGHTPVTLAQLRDWESCPSWPGFTAANYTAGARAVEFADPCDYFTTGKAKASTLSLSVLVAIEMFNAANALSEDNSLSLCPCDVFSIVPLSFQEWLLVLAYSLPVVLIDEVLKAVGRTWVNKSTAAADRAAGKAKLE
ncbi:hypothetical protein APUTEX25_000013, partial [Auxenochlorella protothecoides]